MDPRPCPRCGCTDIRVYDEEQPICPHCGTVLARTPPRAPIWLDQWPQARRSTIANWFYAAVRSGHTDPSAIVEAVQGTLHRRLQWTANLDQRQWLSQILNTMADDPRAAQAYAASVVAREHLPPAEKSALKHERAKAFVLEAMRGKPITEKQAWLIRSTGYTDAIPQDRAEASALIDRLLTHKEGGQ
jgi:hypothetical protein